MVGHELKARWHVDVVVATGATTISAFGWDDPYKCCLDKNRAGADRLFACYHMCDYCARQAGFIW